MSSVKRYYKIIDNELNELILNILGDTIIPYSNSKIRHAIVLLEDGSVSEDEITLLIRENLVIILKDEINALPENNLKYLTLCKNFIANNQQQFKHIIYFLSDLYQSHATKLTEIEEQVFHLALSSTDMLESHEILSEKLAKDGLTGLYNHTAFQDRLKILFDNYKNNREIFSIAILDLDFFKKVNDTFGHLKGDEVLKSFASVINDSVRVNDFPARYGGEEFAIIFPKINKYQAEKILERLRTNFKEVEFLSGEEKFFVTFSAGVAEINDNITSTTELIKLADKAMYASKTSGRNKTTLA
ncbi:GGDEF domain-containing protein [Deferribacteraceae bacterium V6Fe1]|nr:GGDEF domain-containing protein [Deferribacteraceae bacterium V6Fe1]